MNIILKNRKTYSKILQRALKKCKRFYLNEICIECTPTEFVVLCLNFNFYDLCWTYHAIKDIKKGEMRTNSYYIKANKSILDEYNFPISNYYENEYNNCVHKNYTTFTKYLNSKT